jgi:adenylate kinase
MTIAAIANRFSAVLAPEAATPRILVLIGPPGCGKGTQARFITRNLGIPAISTGEILRDAAGSQTELGRRLRAVMESGGLVGDEIVNELVAARILDDDCRDGFVLDGYPRTVQQAEYFGRMLRERGLPEPEAVVLDVRLDRLVTRLTARRLCPLCGRIYNLISAPPAEDEFCDDDGMFLVKRADDEERVIRERFLAYERTTAPLLRHYGNGRMHRIDASAEVECVAAHVEAAVGL